MKDKKPIHFFTIVFIAYSIWRLYWFTSVPIDIYFKWAAPIHAKIWAVLFFPLLFFGISFYSYHFKIVSKQKVLIFWKTIFSYWTAALILVGGAVTVNLFLKYKNEGFYFRNIYEIVWFYIFIPIFISLFFLFLNKRNIISKETKQNLFTSFNSLIVVLVFLELIIRIFSFHGEFRFYYGKVQHPFFQDKETWFHLWEPNSSHHLKSEEFKFERTTNSLGFSDKEWEIEKPEGQIRILALGDSFTEGDGVAFEDSYPSVLQNLINKEYLNNDVLVMNAGVCGSDPFFQYKILEQQLFKYSPDIVLFTNSPNDIFYDYVIYGGFERFLPDSSTAIKPPNKQWWLPVYYNSFLFQFVITHTFYDSYLFEKKQKEDAVKNRMTDFSELFKSYEKLSEKHGFIVFQIMRPETDDFKLGSYENNKLIEEMFLNSRMIKNIDLLSLYLNNLNIDKKNQPKYYWPINGHHNKKGYDLMANAVFIGIKNHLDILVETKN